MLAAREVTDAAAAHAIERLGTRAAFGEAASATQKCQDCFLLGRAWDGGTVVSKRGTYSMPLMKCQLRAGLDLAVRKSRQGFASRATKSRSPTCRGTISNRFLHRCLCEKRALPS